MNRSQISELHDATGEGVGSPGSAPLGPAFVSVRGRDVRVDGRWIRIARIHGDKYRFLEDPESLIAGLRQCGSRIDLFTFMQKLPESVPKYPHPMEWDNLAALPVSTYEAWWTKQVDSKTRNMVRRAEKKGVEVREVPFDDLLIRGIWTIYNESPVRRGRPFWHYGKDETTLRREHGTFLDSSIFIGAFLEDKLIGFIKLTCNETRSQAGLMNIVSMIQHREKAPTNALIARAVRSCAERGIAFMVYSNFVVGKKQRDSLSDFKRNNGFQRVNLPRYFVPLTRRGWLAFQLGLHRTLVGRLPESIAVRVRALRTTWYNRQVGTSTEPS
jgi:hypothetical protein